MRKHDTPLIDAARHGRAADVAALLADGADVNEPKELGMTALYIACVHGFTDIVTTRRVRKPGGGRRRLRGARDPARRHVGGVARGSRCRLITVLRILIGSIIW